MRRELKRIEKDLTKEEPESDEEARRTTSIEENSKGTRKTSQPQQLFQKKRLAEIEEEIIQEAATSTE